MRVIAGRFKGRGLFSPRGRGLRPTSDRVKGAIFDILGERIRGARVLDLFAGSGNLGIEAISRGAASADFVDKNPGALRLISRNLELLGVRASLYEMDALDAIGLMGRRGESFDVIFVDPPYGRFPMGAVLDSLARFDICRPGGMVVLEHDRREEVPEEVGGKLLLKRQKRYGNTIISFYERGGTEDA
ncbi:MAG: 16S rRNA (guanine(966)-N(2))-methyltransferase RsmD [bacterium]